MADIPDCAFPVSVDKFSGVLNDSLLNVGVAEVQSIVTKSKSDSAQGQITKKGPARVGST
jgi:hypothetical protein